MERKRRAGKRRRTYDASGRRAQGERGGAAVVDAAERLFLDGGYAATTVASIAAASEASVRASESSVRASESSVRASESSVRASESSVRASESSVRAPECLFERRS